MPIAAFLPKTDFPPSFEGFSPVTNPSNVTLTTQNSIRRGGSVKRARSLTRPDRHRPRPTLFNYEPSPPQQIKNMNMMRARNELVRDAAIGKLTTDHIPSDEAKHTQAAPRTATTSKMSWWSITANIATCCIPSCFLSYCLKKRNPLVRQAWREKVTLVYIIIFCCLALAYLTFGLQRTLCPEQRQTYPYSTTVNGATVKVYRQNITVYGKVYPFEYMQSFFATKGLNVTKEYQGVDMSGIFDADISGACKVYDIGRSGSTTTAGNCSIAGPYGGTLNTTTGNCIPLKDLYSSIRSNAEINYGWNDLRPEGTDNLHGSNLFLLGENVLDVSRYLDTNLLFYGQNTDNSIRRSLGNDGSLSLANWPDTKAAEACLLARYRVGVIQTETGGCIAAGVVMDIMLGIIISLIAVRYTMAVMFRWFIAGNLVKPGGRSGILSWRSVQNGNNDPYNRQAYETMPRMYGSGSRLNTSAPQSYVHAPKTSISTIDLYTVMLVTCYSEGMASIKSTMDSLAETNYSKRHKIFVVIADGIITGSGETQSTPDMVLSMLDLDPSSQTPQPCYYQAIADGEKQLNRAKYAGYYKHATCPTPCLLIVKCGTSSERNSSKPGNRGKRDSQLILMTFFQHVLFNDRLTELHYEMFWKMTKLMHGTTPDKFEVVLMVDADTRVMPKSLTYMVEAMKNDITIMGLCGETRIANKRQSWVTAIQVFEYYISHHYAKAFESFFGGVTCLPGCFSMYRIKAPKNGAWIPILASPDIILEYNQNVVTTLHAKNLLLLGEDRFLSTLLLRTFPRRQMVFVPQATCKTVVPDKFSVLLSQRRRWINSTVHNLMELVMVSDLCGIACLSMQFSVLIDLIGTVVLPAAIVMTIWLIISSVVSESPQWQPIILLASVLGLPVVLIVVTMRKFVYILWMIIYIIALPVWNLVLPIYAFWHFDDFSWGSTRVIEGEVKASGHDDENKGLFDPTRLVIKHVNEWEIERTGRTIYTTQKGRRSYYGLRNSVYSDAYVKADPRYRYTKTNSSLLSTRPAIAAGFPIAHPEQRLSSRSSTYNMTPPSSTSDLRHSAIKSLNTSNSTNTVVVDMHNSPFHDNPSNTSTREHSSSNSSVISRTIDNDSSTVVP
ncbi:hypothetical protein INT43_002258 [Umbelopsis isabellina]|uniref:chitin synthase n=1 Tax=Mortierella isabellina TaxID=91625 RepID=A0A8H7Q6V6_MORIS|nr:hypothetical protein INT43_002258 [Umbelopsis isabellina]